MTKLGDDFDCIFEDPSPRLALDVAVQLAGERLPHGGFGTVRIVGWIPPAFAAHARPVEVRLDGALVLSSTPIGAWFGHRAPGYGKDERPIA